MKYYKIQRFDGVWHVVCTNDRITYSLHLDMDVAMSVMRKLNSDERLKSKIRKVS